MLVDKITSKEQLIKALADELDDCFDLSYPVVDLTDQIVATVMDSAYSDPDVNDWLHGHEVVSIEPLDSHESYSIMGAGFLWASVCMSAKRKEWYNMPVKLKDEIGKGKR